MTFTLPDPMEHQKLIHDFALRPYSGIYLEAGGGKTLSVLATLNTVRPSGHILVIAPIAVARATWINEIARWGFPIRTKSLIVNDNDKKLTRAKRWERYAEVADDPPTMYFISVSLVQDLVREIGDWPFETVIIDESQEFKGHDTERFKAMRSVREASGYSRMIQLSGTPTPQGLLDLWSQVYLLDGGEALGKNITTYRDTYFRATVHVDDKPVAWEPYDWAEEVIYDKISHLVISAKNADIPLPEVLTDEVFIDLPEKLMKKYKEFTKEMVLDLAVKDPDTEKVTISADNAGVLHAKQLQFASGTVYTGENHDTDFEVLHDIKLELTDYYLRNAGGEPTIVAYRFRSDRTRLLEHLKKQGYDPEVFDGSMDMQNRWNAGKIPVMLLQPASYRHGVNLQNGGRRLLWFTMPDSYEHFHQTNRRLERIGQKQTVFITCLIVRNTKDAKMPGLLEKKHSTQRRLLDAVQHQIVEIAEDPALRNRIRVAEPV